MTTDWARLRRHMGERHRRARRRYPQPFRASSAPLHSYELDGQRLPPSRPDPRRHPQPKLVDWAAASPANTPRHIDRSRLERDAAVDLIKSAHRRSTSSAAARRD